jgi:putative transposase
MKTERILIKPSNKAFLPIKMACINTCKIYNSANYQMRQAFFNGEKIKWSSADKIIKLKQEKLYSSIPNAASQAIIKKLGDDWNSFFKALKSFKKSPSKFKKRPKPPKYSDKIKSYTQPFQALKCIDNYIHFPKKMGINPIKTMHCENQDIQEKDKKRKIISEIRFIPHGHCFWLEIVYDQNVKEKKEKKVLLDKERVIGIDLGINNLLTIVSNVESLTPLLVKGKVIKSINQRYNKKKAYYQAQKNTAMIEKLSVKRFCQLSDFFHKVSHNLLQYCLKNNLGKVIIGKNDQWKNKINIGKVNNQKFTNIPYNSLIEKIKYKLENYGIEVIENEESYTSKSDALVCDILPKYTEKQTKKHTFLGKRLKRGLYLSSNKKLINADVNGAINILRKVIGDGFVKILANKGYVYNPVIWCFAPNN